MVNDQEWKEPEFKGLTLLGTSRDCQAMIMAQGRECLVVEEAELCQEIGCPANTVVQWLAKYWIDKRMA
jgi:hypothetical protein